MDVVGAQGDGAEEDAGAPSPPLHSGAPALGAHLACDVSGDSAGRAIRDLCDEVVERLVAGGRLEEAAFDIYFYDMLATHFARFPPSYHLYVNTVQAEDAIVHIKLLEEAMDPDRRPAIHAQFLRDEDPIVDMKTNPDPDVDAISAMPGLTCSIIHEIIFGTVNNPRLLSQLSTVLHDVGLNVKDKHLFPTSDGFCICAFTVEGWHSKCIMGLVEELKISISKNEELKTPNSSASSSNSGSYSTATESISLGSYATGPESLNLASYTTAPESKNLARYTKMRKRADNLKQQKKMESFRAILSDSIAFVFPAMLAIFTSDFEFHDSEKPFLISVFSMGGLLILLNMVLSHGVEDGEGRMAVVSALTLLTVIYVFGVFEYCLYKFFPAGDYQLTALHCICAHFIFGVLMLRWLWACSFKTNS